jgi:hypothetical protein
MLLLSAGDNEKSMGYNYRTLKFSVAVNCNENSFML